LAGKQLKEALDVIDEIVDAADRGMGVCWKDDGKGPVS
jgi:hypothetical protein